jgi:hypothetical protein
MARHPAGQDVVGAGAVAAAAGYRIDRNLRVTGDSRYQALGARDAHRMRGALPRRFAARRPADAAEVLEKSKYIARVTVHYEVVLPSHYPAKPYPAVLAFGGGPQSMHIVDGAIQRNWRDERSGAATWL